MPLLFSGEIQKDSIKYMLCLGFLLLKYELEGPKLVHYEPEKDSIEITWVHGIAEPLQTAHFLSQFYKMGKAEKNTPLDPTTCVTIYQ